MSEETAIAANNNGVGEISRPVQQIYAPLTTGVQVGQLPHFTSMSSTAYLRMLLFGGIGTGKTYCAATTWPGLVETQGYPAGVSGIVYLMDCLNEADGLDGYGNIVYEKVRDFPQILNRIAYLQTMLEKYPGLFRVVIVDQMTEMQRFLLQSACGAEVPEKRHWGIVLNQMEIIVRSIQDLPCHSIFIANENEWQGVYTPYLDGKLKNEILGKFSVIGRMMCMQVEDAEKSTPQAKAYKMARWIQFEMTGNTSARVRGGKLPAAMFPNMSEIVRVYQTKKTETNNNV